ncbi:helix-turn-helix domain-containing protein [Bifidobacterium mongoliense]|jgi:transcriptional regulator with XRE-family HTH domain|uniref:helix-turn-helix domain-containing protein n=2 Tax=Bifidobacterium mongoliense TaxID=518643 RepID=UPI0030EDFE2F
MYGMGSKKIEVSRFGLRVSRAIRAEMGARRISNRQLAKQMGRAEHYVRERVNDNNEWSLSDIELICNLWGITIDKLFNTGTYGLAALQNDDRDIEAEYDADQGA